MNYLSIVKTILEALINYVNQLLNFLNIDLNLRSAL